MDIKRTLEQEARRCQWLVLWLDCDREGENIAFEVVEVCTAVNHHLTIKRAHFSALIERFYFLKLSFPVPSSCLKFMTYTLYMIILSSGIFTKLCRILFNQINGLLMQLMQDK